MDTNYLSDFEEYDYSSDDCSISSMTNNNKKSYNISSVHACIFEKNPENIIWLKQIEKWIKESNKNYIIDFDPNYPLKCNFTIIDEGDILGNFIWEVNKEKPYFPQTPPKMKWISPQYNFKTMCSLKYMEPLHIRYWNFCQDLDNLLNKIYLYLKNVKLNIQSNTELYEHLYNIIEISEIYPTSFLSELPKFGIIHKQHNKKIYKKYSGIQYSQGTIEDWDFSDHESKKKKLDDIFTNLYDFLVTNNITPQNINDIKISPLVPYLIHHFNETSTQEILKNQNMYDKIFNISMWILDNIGFIDLHRCMLIKLSELITIIDKLSTLSSFDLFIQNTYHKIKMKADENSISCNQQTKLSKLEIGEKLNHDSLVSDYPLQFQNKQFQNVDRFHFHKFQTNNSSYKIKSKWIRRLLSEWCDLKHSLPLTFDHSIFMAWSSEENTPYLFKILFFPPFSTPYAGGCYEFDMYIPPEYPNVNPELKFLTTGNNKVRFNPNLYNCGKVCLSLLGTWNGEKWNPEYSNINQICMSILALIFVDDPYFNEPGYQNSCNSEEGKKRSNEYNDRIRLYNLKYGILENLKTSNSVFKSIIHKNFKCRKHKILETIESWIEKSTDSLQIEKLKSYYGEINIIE